MSDTIVIGGHEASLSGILEGVEAGSRLDGRATIALRKTAIWVVIREDAGRDEPALHDLAESLGFKVADRCTEHVRFTYRASPLSEENKLAPAEAVENLLAWVEAWDGQTTGIPNGEYAGYTVRREDGSYVVRCDKALVNTLRRIEGASISSGGAVVPYRSGDALQKVLDRASKAAKKGEAFEFLSVPGITVTVNGSVISIAFPYDRDLVASVKSLPGAKFNGGTKCWTVNLRQREKVQSWLESCRGARVEASKKVQAEKAAKKEKLDQARAVGKLAIDGISLTQSRVQVYGDVCKIYTRYDDQLVCSFRQMKGRWDSGGRSWTIDLAHGVELAKALEDAEPRLATAVEADARRASNPSVMVLEADAPEVGTAFRLGRSSVVTCTRLSKRRWISDDEGDAYYTPEFWGVWVHHVYYRDATPEEIAALEEKEAAQARWENSHRAVADLRRQIDSTKDYFNLGREPTGEILWENATHRISGTHYWVVLDDDGYLWNVTYDGSDDAGWGNYNLGYNTRGSRLKATPEMIQTLRDAAEIRGFKTRRSTERA